MLLMNSALSTIILFITLLVGKSATATDVVTTSTSTKRQVVPVDRRRRYTRSDGSTPCLTELTCQERYTALYNAGVITGYYYSDSSAATPVVSTKGCIIKGNNVYFTFGTNDEMTAPVSGTKKIRLYCLPIEEEDVVMEDMSFSILLSLSMMPSTTKASKPFIEAAAELSLSMSEELSMSIIMSSMPLGTKASKPNRFID